MKDEKSSGSFLSLIPHPSSFIPFHGFPFLLDLVQQLVHPLAFFFDCIPDEMNLRSAREIERETQLFANVGSGVTQGAERQPLFLFVAGNRDKDLRVAAIIGKA